MKTVYIPKGETVRYESLMTEHLVVHGCLQVSNGIKARTIAGSGTVRAGAVTADVIRVDDVDAGSIVCKRLLAKRVQSPEVYASESAAVSCFLAACYVETGKLTVTLSEIDAVNAAEIVNLTPKKRTLFGTLLASLLRSIWTALTVPGQKEPTVVTDACEEVPEDVAEPVPEETQEQMLLSDILNRFLEGLPKQTRIIFVQRYFYLCPVRDIARDLGLGESMVKTTLFRTRNALRERLEEEGISV